MNRHSDEEPPDSTDLEGWRQAVADGSFRALAPEALVAAIQDLGPKCDRRVLNPLVLEASDIIQRVLRRTVGRNHNNEGIDIIDRAHRQLVTAMISPQSADGKGLRVAFFARVEMRAIDAIRAEDKISKREVADDSETEVEDEPGQAFNPWTDVDERMDVERALEAVTDDRKRLAFRLYMEGDKPYAKVGSSIAKTLRVSGKTAAKWIEEVRAILKDTIGDKS